MSRIGAIRAGLETVLKSVDGIVQVQAYPPASINANGTAWIGFFDDQVTMGPREIHLHVVPVTVCVKLNAQHKQGLINTEPLIDATLAKIRANQKLGLNDVMRVEVTRVQQGVWEVGGGDQFIGFQISLEIKESFAASYTSV